MKEKEEKIEVEGEVAGAGAGEGEGEFAEVAEVEAPFEPAELMFALDLLIILRIIKKMD